MVLLKKQGLCLLFVLCGSFEETSAVFVVGLLWFFWRNKHCVFLLSFLVHLKKHGLRFSFVFCGSSEEAGTVFIFCPLWVFWRNKHCLFFVFCGCSFCMAWLIVSTCTYGNTTLYSRCVVLFMNISVEGARSSDWLWRLCQWYCVSETAYHWLWRLSVTYFSRSLWVQWSMDVLCELLWLWAGTGSPVHHSETQLSTAQWNTAVNSTVKHSCQQHSETHSCKQHSETQLSAAHWHTAVNSTMKHSCQQHSETAVNSIVKHSCKQHSETQLSTAQWNTAVNSTVKHTAVNSTVKHSCQQHSETQL